MKKIVRRYLPALIGCALLVSLNGCLSTSPGIQFNLPERPELPGVEWKTEGAYCLNDEGAKNLEIGDVLLNGYIDELIITIDECNKALNE